MERYATKISKFTIGINGSFKKSREMNGFSYVRELLVDGGKPENFIKM